MKGKENIIISSIAEILRELTPPKIYNKKFSIVTVPRLPTYKIITIPIIIEM